MENQNKHTVSNFWFGFLLGSAGAITAAFLFGTKNGRKTLQKLLSLSENLEENILMIAEELGEELKEKAEEINIELPKSKNSKNESTIGTILHKIKSLSPQQSGNKKRFFVKE
jgi:hypothetical protein